MYYSLNKSAFDKKKTPKNKTIVGITFYCFTDQREKNRTLLVTSQEYANNFYLFAKCYET